MTKEEIAVLGHASCHEQFMDVSREVMSLKTELEAANPELAILKPNPKCDRSCMLSCKMEADEIERLRTEAARKDAEKFKLLVGEMRDGMVVRLYRA